MLRIHLKILFRSLIVNNFKASFKMGFTWATMDKDVKKIIIKKFIKKLNFQVDLSSRLAERRQIISKSRKINQLKLTQIQF